MISPHCSQDGFSAAYNNHDFWANEGEYGDFDLFAARDYKSPAASLLNIDEVMIQSVDFGAEDTNAAYMQAEIRGWRTWPTLQQAPIGSWF
eukprot:SAG11_NODE_17250_length_524_cov_0.670588_1_plen_90_part_10